MERKFSKEFKEEFMKMQVGEDWNKLKEKHNISKYEWDSEMKEHFEELLEKYSDYEVRKK